MQYIDTKAIVSFKNLSPHFFTTVKRQKKLDDRLRAQLQREKQNLQKIDDYYQSRIRERSAKEKDREKTLVELLNETNKAREEQLRNQLQQLQQQSPPQNAQQQPQILPIVIPGNAIGDATARDREPQAGFADVVGELRELRDELRNRPTDVIDTGRMIQGNGELPQNYSGRPERGIKLRGKKRKRY